MANISVNIAQMKISKPPDVLVAMGLGSCIGVALYDPLLKIGGMLHVLLPSADGMDKDAKRTKFANPGIYDFVEAMVKAGACKANLVAKLAGGASLLNNSAQVGQRNAEECLKLLDELRIKVEAKDVGGANGRTVYFDIATGAMTISTLAKGKKTI